MQQVFCLANPQYIPDTQMDFLPLMTIAKFILKKFYAGENDVVKNKDAILGKWRGICEWISQNSFYKTKPLKTIASQIQEVIQTPENETHQPRTNSARPTTRSERTAKGIAYLMERGSKKFDEYGSKGVGG